MKSHASLFLPLLLLLGACVGGVRASDEEGFVAGPPRTAGSAYPAPPSGYERQSAGVEPSYGPPPQGYAPQPSYQQPGAGYAPPSAATPQPGAGYQRPDASYSQPGASYQQPGAAYAPPGASYPQQAQQPSYPPPATQPGGYGDPTAGAAGPRGSSQRQQGEERYDEVGYAGGGIPGLGQRLGPDAVAAAHRTLAPGTIVEVTAIDTGRTILAVVTDRGPPRNDLILDLSAGAARQLGLSQVAVIPVRVRKVVPSAQDQAALNSGQPASARLDAPAPLLAGLRRSLPAAPAAGGSYTPSVPAPTQPGAAYVVPGTRPATPAQSGGYYVQVAVISNAANAQAFARQIGGVARPAGGMYRVQLGPFADAGDAERARQDMASRGYPDAYVFIQQ